MSDTPITQKIHITGIVQGVGFRPYVFNLASKMRINGWVRNTSSGLEIVASGEPSDLDRFIQALRNHPPTLAHVDSFEASLSEYEQFDHFEIRESNSVSTEFVPISPDISICDDCRRELFDQVGKPPTQTRATRIESQTARTTMFSPACSGNILRFG